MPTSIRVILAALPLLCAALPAAAQHTVQTRVVDAHDRTPLPGVNVVLDGTATGGATDADGRLTLGPLPAGSYTLRFSFVGYAPARIPVTIPLADPAAVIEVALQATDVGLGEATVTATRTSRTIADTPTRVETIGAEEIGEKIVMDPSGISMILTESPGIVVQQTSVVSGSAGFRIQGLDGRYTQLLRDGFPLYGGLGGGLSILQIPPLDLARVEVIKGPASTLYGGDAIAGLINLITRRPTREAERSVLVNGTSAGGLDVAAYAAHRGDRLGYTVLASANGQRAYDADRDAFTNLPATRRLTLSPTLYRYGTGTLTAGLSGTAEVRTGGDVEAVRGGAGYAERNVSKRLTAFAGYERTLPGGVRGVLRTSGSAFRRAVAVPGFRFSGRQASTYTEASASVRRGAHDLVGGLDLRTDGFRQAEGETPGLGYGFAAAGAFVQDTWDVAPALVLEAGLRADLHSAYGPFVLPRVSVLVRPAEGWAVRAGGGLGYKAPTPFLEEAEVRAFRGVRPPDGDVEAERSAGGGVDVNYRAVAGPLVLTLNQAVYLTRLTRPLIPVEEGGVLTLRTAPGHVEAAGSETTARLSFADFTLFLGYVFVDVDRVEGGDRLHQPLTARHRTYSVLMWEAEERGRVGIEAYYTGPQALPDGGESPGFLVTGLMAQWRFGGVTAFANLENFLDARQSRTAPLVLGPRDAPTFAPVWGPTDGFVANAGVIVHL